MLDLGLRLAVAGLVGLAVGIERQWSGHASGPHARFAGVRTFLLLGLLGGVAGTLADAGAVALAASLVAGGLGITLLAYLAATRRSDDPEAIEGTTEVAAVLVLGLGVTAGLGLLAIASGVTAVMVLALREKQTIQGFVARLGENDLRGAFQFAVLALVVLPLLPEGPFGPFGGVRPRTIWMVVLIFSGLNYLGYLARRVLGQHRGYGIAGALGGLVSSTAVALTFGRRSRVEPAFGASLGVGTVAACAVLVPRVLAVSWVLNPSLGRTLLVGLAPSLLLGFGLVAYLARHPAGAAAEPDPPAVESPLQLGSAIQMALAFQLVMLIVEFAGTRYGVGGLYGSAAILGLTDMDALTFSMSRLGSAAVPDVVAATAILIGIVTNTVLKLAISVGLGAPGYRRSAGLGLAGLGGATLVGILVLAR